MAMEDRLFEKVVLIVVSASLIGSAQPAFSSGKADSVIRIASTVIVLTPEKRELVADLLKRKVEGQEKINRELEGQMEAGYAEMEAFDTPKMEAAFYTSLNQAIGEGNETACRIGVEDTARRLRIPIGLPNRYLTTPIQLAHDFAERKLAFLNRKFQAGLLDATDLLEAESHAQDIDFLMKVFDIPLETEVPIESSK